MAFGNNTKNLYVRMSMKDARKVEDGLKRIGKDGQEALKRIERASKPASRGLRAVDSTVGALGRSLQGFVGIGVFVAGLRTLGRYSMDTIRVASEVEEAIGKFDAVFKEQAASAKTWAREQGDALGRSRFDLMTYMATLQDTFVPLGFARAEAAEMSKQLVALGVDLAAFDNMAEPETINLLTSALVGNHEAVRRFGIIITESTLKTEIQRQGWADSVQKATELQKAQARLNIIMRNSADAQGAALREADSYANKQRAMDATFKDLSVTIGNMFMPAAKEVTDWLKDSAKGWQLYLQYLGKVENISEKSVLNKRLGETRKEVAERKHDLKDLEATVDRLNRLGGATNLVTAKQTEQRAAHLRSQIRASQAELESLEAQMRKLEGGGKPAKTTTTITTTPTTNPADAVKERKRALTYLATLEANHAKEILDKRALLTRQEAAEIAKLDALRAAGTIQEGEHFQARLQVTMTFWKQRHEIETKAEEKSTRAGMKALEERKRARLAALGDLARLSERYADETLTDTEKLNRARVKELAEVDALHRKGLVNERETYKAKFQIAAHYIKKEEKLKKDADKKTFGGQAKSQVNAYFDNLANAGARAGAFVVGAFKSVEDALTEFFLSGEWSFKKFAQSIKAGLARLAAQDIVSAIGGLFNLGSSGPATGGSWFGSILGGIGSFLGGLFADGGLVRGPGTGTSDSIVARLSDHEYVVRAASAKKYLPLLEAINDDSLGGFAGGGQVRAADGLPRFYWGGSATNVGGETDKEYADHSAAATGNWGTDDQQGGGDDKKGQDGGGFWQGLSDFFTGPTELLNEGPWQTPAMAEIHGNVNRSGFFGSGAAGVLTTILGSLLGGPFGFFAGTAATFAMDLAREVATKGAAGSTGLAGMVHDLATGRKTAQQLADALASHFPGSQSGPGFGLAGQLAGGPGGGGGGSLSNDNQNWSLADLGFGPAAMTAGFQKGVGGSLATLQDDWQRDYRDVQLTGARVMRGLRHGGRVRAGETVVVGDGGEPETVTVDAPGTVTPMRTAFAETADGDGAAVDELKALRAEFAAMNANMEQVLRLMMLRADAPSGLPGTRGVRAA